MGLPARVLLPPLPALVLIFAAQLQVTRPTPAFVDVTAGAGIDFAHHHGGTGAKLLPETMGSGLAWLDYDVDGAWDLYLVDSGKLPVPGSGAAAPETRAGGTVGPSEPSQGANPASPYRNVLYRNDGHGRFARVLATGAEDRGYGMGTAASDYDLDGWPDLFVTNFGSNAMFRNNGDGTFEETTEAAGLGGENWSASAAFADLDKDGFPELYVTNYLEYDLDDPLRCGRLEAGIVSYCHVSLFDGAADSLYDNRGDGRFVDVSVAAGIAKPEGKSLGVAIGDVDGDGNADIYVANDTTGNSLFINSGDLSFEDVALLAGVGYGPDGEPQAGMGVAIADVDGDSSSDVLVTNFSFEPMNFYRLAAPGAYLDDAMPLGLGQPSMAPLGFGVVVADLDGDGDLDVAVANGHILDNVEAVQDNTTYGQSNQILVNRLDNQVLAGTTVAPGDARGGATAEPAPRPSRDLLVDASEAAGPAFVRRRVSRGLASADFDGDGNPDLAVSNSDGPAELLRNVTRSPGNRLVLRLRGRRSNRDALGARIRITPVAASGESGRTQTYELGGGSSYCSQSATDLYPGLGDAAAARVQILWPGSGSEDLGVIEAGALVLIVEGRGAVARKPLQRGEPL